MSQRSRHEATRLRLPTRLLLMLSERGPRGRAVATRLELMRIEIRSMARPFRKAARHSSHDLAWSKDETYRRIWTEAASAIGAELTEYAPGYFRFTRNNTETIAWRQHVMIDSPATTTLASDKPVLLDLLRAANLPVPAHVTAEIERPARLLGFLSSSPGPCVVKPARGTSGGDGVTCGVRSPDELVQAWLLARRYCPVVIAERQVAGDSYRLLFLDGKLLAALRRQPPSVIGDGHRSIHQLIATMNDERITLGPRSVSRLVHIDLECLLTLSRAGLSLRSVPTPGQRVMVKASVSENSRTDNEATTYLAPELVDSARRAAEAARLRLAGVDLVTTDPQQPLEGHGAIIEVNGTPGLHYHYQVGRADTHTAVAVPILKHLLPEM